MSDLAPSPRAILAGLAASGRRAATPCGDGDLVWHVWDGGPPIVLLHGNHGSWRHWARNIPALARRFTVLAPDLPGNGESDLPPLPASLDDIVTILRGGLDALVRPTTPVIVFGFSYGSIMAGELARVLGSRASHLVLVGPAGLGLPQRLGEELQRWRHLEEQNARRAAHRRNLEILMIKDPANVDALAVEIQAFGAESHRMRERPSMGKAPLAEALPEIKARVTAIWGGADGAAGPYLQDRRDRLTALRPDAAQFLIEGAGHWVQYEAAVRFNRLMDEILA